MPQGPVTVLVHLTAIAVVSDRALEARRQPRSPPATSLPSDLTASKTKCLSFV